MPEQRKWAAPERRTPERPRGFIHLGKVLGGGDLYIDPLARKRRLWEIFLGLALVLVAIGIVVAVVAKLISIFR